MCPVTQANRPDLIQLVGFSHPDDLFRDNGFSDVVKRLWYFVASVCFRSTEAFAGYLHVEDAMHACTTQSRRHTHMFLSNSSGSYNNQLMDWSIDSIQVLIRLRDMLLINSGLERT